MGCLRTVIVVTFALAGPSCVDLSRPSQDRTEVSPGEDGGFPRAGAGGGSSAPGGQADAADAPDAPAAPGPDAQIDPGAVAGQGGVVGGVAGSGGATSGGGSSGSTVCDGVEGEDLVLWNFERADVNAFAFGVKKAGQSGWELMNDGTPGTQSRTRMAAVHIQSCAENQALRYSADGYKDWGSGARAVILPDRRFYDAGGYAGLRFRVRAEGFGWMAIKVLDANTVGWGGRCKTCIGRWTKAVTPTSSWTTVRLSFSEFELQGANDLQPPQIDAAAVVGFEFVIDDGPQRHLWIDDVALFR